MKNLAFITAILISGIGFSQTEDTTSTDTVTSVISPERKAEIQKEIQQKKAHLKAIEIKRDYVNSNEEEKALATEQGWFEQIERIENQLIEKINYLENLIKD